MFTTQVSTAPSSPVARCRSQEHRVTVLGMGPEWWIVLAVVVLIFGASQLPKLARSLGQAQKEFKKGLSDSASAEGDKEGEKPASS